MEGPRFIFCLFSPTHATANTTFRQIRITANTPLALERVFYPCCLKSRIQQPNGWWNRNTVPILTQHPSSPGCDSCLTLIMFRGRIFHGCLFYSLWVVFVTRYEQNEKGDASGFIQHGIRYTEAWQRMWGNTHFFCGFPACLWCCQTLL